MRTLFITLGFITAILAVVLAFLPLSNFAFIPAVLAFIFGLLAFFQSKKEELPTGTIKIIFLLTIIALTMATYKAIFSTTEVGNTEQLEQRDVKSEEDAKEELEGLDLSE